MSITTNTKQLSKKFKEKRLKWDSKIITHGEYVVRFENKKVVCKDYIFIQDPYDSIFVTQDLYNFILIGKGNIQTSLDNSILVESDDHYWIYNNGITILLYFYIENDKLVYYHTKRDDLSKTNVRIISYENLLVVVSSMNALFLGMTESLDVQFRFYGAVIDFYTIKNNGIKFLSFEYNKNEEHRFALFYQNVLLSSDVVLENISSHLNILFTPKTHSHLGLNDKKSSTNYSAQIKFTRNTSEDPSKDYTIGYDLDDDFKNQYYPNDTISELNNVRNIQESFKCKNRCIFNMNILQKKAFAVASPNSKILFLKAVFSGGQYDIINENLDVLIHTTRKMSSLLLKDQHNVLQTLSKIREESFFYSDPCVSLNKKLRKMKFKQKLTEEEERFLARRYDRLFYFNKDVKNSRNLAYKIIEKENEYRYDMNMKMQFKQMVSYNKTFMKLVSIYFGDTRLEDVIQILLEDSIIMHPEIYDTNNFRQKTFLVRICSGIGAYILNYKARYYHSIYRSPPKLNSTILSEKINRNMAFMNAATYFSYFKIPPTGDIYEELGHAFGNGLLFGIDDTTLQKYINMISSASDSVLKFIFLVISTYNIPRNTTINTILKSGLESNSIDVMAASMCALAIYNLNTHDRHIIEILEKELNKYGPVNNERTNVFYTNKYRKISAICIGLISERAIFPKCVDTFCELIITGLSSIGKCPYSEIFFRSDDCRPDEVFYSILFGLTSDFSMKPDDILESFVISDLESPLDFYKCAAKIFYISLYYHHHQISYENHIYEKIFNLALDIEDSSENITRSIVLLNFSLISLSIMKMGTSDIELLRILRRQILKTKDVKMMQEYVIYDSKKKDFVSFKGCSMESMQMYKICVGILCLDFGISKLNQSFIKNLIVSFFLSETHSLDFHFIDILRMSIVKGIYENPMASQKFKDIATDLSLKNTRKKIMKNFREQFEKMEDIDRKFIIDVLSDYYENHYFTDRELQCDFSNPKTVFDIKALLKLLLVSK